MGILMTVQQYADRRGVTRQTVYNAINAGRIEWSWKKGKLDPEACDATWDPRPTIQSPPPQDTPSPEPEREGEDDDGYNYQTARARKEQATAELAELKLRAELGEVVPVKDVRKAWSEVLSAVRTRFLAMPDRLGATLAAESEAHACRSILADEIDEVLRLVADDVG